jgi:hypothetical protein
VGATAESTCQACPANSGSALTSQTAVGSCLCNPGYTGPNGGPCTTCVAGKYKIVTGTAACTDCDVNKFSPATGATAASTCQSCPASSQSTTGSDAANDCVCVAGFSGPDGGACTACGAGKYKISTGSAACLDCGAGKYSAATGASVDATCLDCGANTYSTATGAATCQSCPTNSQSLIGSSLSTSCHCNAGYTGQNGGPCTACAVAKYKIEVGSAQCTRCNPYGEREKNWAPEAHAGPCIPCGPSMWADHPYASETDCVCDDLTFGPRGGPCTQCPPNMWAWYGEIVTDCFCGAGSYGPPGGPCTQCPPGMTQYNIGPGETSSIADCFCIDYAARKDSVLENGCVLCPSSTTLDWEIGECVSGSTEPDGGTCNTCAAGKYKTATGSAACTDCGANTHTRRRRARRQSAPVRAAPPAHSLRRAATRRLTACVWQASRGPTAGRARRAARASTR